MTTTARLEVKDGDLLGALRDFASQVIGLDHISAILGPLRLPMKNAVMPALMTDAGQLDGIDPLSPAFPLNGAKVVSRLTRKPSGGKIAAFMRPCEVRAFHELVKLKQGRVEDVVLISIDCLGALTNRDYQGWGSDDPDADTKAFYTHILAGNQTPLTNADDAPIELAKACRACEFPMAEGADISIGLYGVDTASMLLLEGQTPAGEELLNSINHAKADPPAAREKAIKDLKEKRTAVRDQMLAEAREATDSLEKLTAYLAGCVNCYNCRVACPVCYCRECVFVTDVFDHDPSQYLRWAENKGAIKIPTDTVLFHITRMVHMSTACVGCGQCSNACPNDISVMELFRTAAQGTQAAFGYEAGRSLDEVPPMAEFREQEFEDVVGLG